MAHFYKLIITAWLAVFACETFAVSVAIAPGVGVATVAGGFTTASNFVGSFSAAAFNANFTTQVAGKAVTMPASMRMAANAGQFAVAAVRLNPTGLIGSAVAAWLLTQGIKWANGQFETSSPAPAGAVSPYRWYIYPGTYFNSGDAACRAYYSGSGYTSGTVISATEFRCNGPYGTLATAQGNLYCTGGQLYYNGACINAVQTAPSTDADFQKLPSLSDSAATELAPKMPLPLEAPQINPLDVPLGDPYVDPKTGKRYQDKARLTPDSSAKQADVQVYKQEVDASNNPVTDPVTQAPKAPEEQTDPCKLNPDASGCKPLDEVDSPDLEKKENPFSLNPVSGFGADNAACPAPQTLFNKGGQAITWDWGKFCGFAQGIRPLIIGFAWLSALMIVVSVGRRNG